MKTLRQLQTAIDDYVEKHPENLDREVFVSCSDDFCGGRLGVLMQRRDEIYDDLVKMAKLQFDKWKEVSNFKGKNDEIRT